MCYDDHHYKRILHPRSKNDLRKTRSALQRTTPSFFSEFLEVFFPEVHEDIDFSKIKPLSEELYTNLLDGENRRIDVAMEVKLKEQDTLIIIHLLRQGYAI